MEFSMKEIADKNEAELRKLVSEAQKELRGLQLKAATQELKDVRSIRALRRTMARFNTRLAQLKAGEAPARAVPKQPSA